MRQSKFTGRIIRKSFHWKRFQQRNINLTGTRTQQPDNRSVFSLAFPSISFKDVARDTTHTSLKVVDDAVLGGREVSENRHGRCQTKNDVRRRVCARCPKRVERSSDEAIISHERLEVVSKPRGAETVQTRKKRFITADKSTSTVAHTTLFILSEWSAILFEAVFFKRTNVEHQQSFPVAEIPERSSTYLESVHRALSPVNPIPNEKPNLVNHIEENRTITVYC
jgi:hypothetical protein